MSRPISHAPDRATVERRRRTVRYLAWSGTVVCFVAGFWIGWTVHAETGAALWILSAALAFVPFLSHRHRL